MENVNDNLPRKHLRSKNTVGRLTLGQKVSHLKEALQHPAAVSNDLLAKDIPENEAYASDAEGGVSTGKPDAFQL